MTSFRQVADQLLEDVAAVTGSAGQSVRTCFGSIFDRSGFVSLQVPGRISCNGSCRLLQAADGWVAINLPRPEDWDMVPALTHGLAKAPDWDSVERWVRIVPSDDVVARGLLLGLAISRPGEAEGTGPGDMLVRMAASRVRNGARLKVVDLSRLWAGPLCGRMFADMGADVIKVDTGTETAGSNEFEARLNSHKRRLRCDFDLAYGSELSELVSQADVLITSGRSRSFAQAGMLPEDLLGMRPGFVWIAITAHGWRGCGADRIGFGDDAAVAGGLVDWKADGTPAFLGDALADPLTGLVAALAGLDALQRGGGYFADVSMSGTAAWVAARMASQDNAF